MALPMSQTERSQLLAASVAQQRYNAHPESRPQIPGWTKAETEQFIAAFIIMTAWFVGSLVPLVSNKGLGKIVPGIFFGLWVLLMGTIISLYCVAKGCCELSSRSTFTSGSTVPAYRGPRPRAELEHSLRLEREAADAARNLRAVDRAVDEEEAPASVVQTSIATSVSIFPKNRDLPSKIDFGDGDSNDSDSEEALFEGRQATSDGSEDDVASLEAVPLVSDATVVTMDTPLGAVSRP